MTTRTPQYEIGQEAERATIKEAAERWPLPTLKRLAEEEPDRSAGWKEEYEHQGVESRGGHND